MKLMIWLLALSGYIISVHCFLNPLVSHPGGIGGIFKGPNSETIIKGPDGSVITSESEGGEALTRTGVEPIVVAETIETDVSADTDTNDGQPSLQVGESLSVTLAPPPEPVISPTSAPIVASLPPVINANEPAVIIQENPHIIETEIVDAPVIEPNQSSDLIGPSGSISTRGSSSVISGPASTTISEPTRVLVAPVIPVVPVVASVTTPILAPSIVQVNQEEPLALSNPLNLLTESAVHPELSPITTDPINAVSPTSLGIGSNKPPLDSRNIHASWVSTLAPPILRGSTIFNSDLGTVVDRSLSFGSSELEDHAVSHSTLLPIDRNQVWSSTITSLDSSDDNNNIVQPASSYGIINNLKVEGNTVSTTPSQELLPPEISSTDMSIQVGGNPQLLDRRIIENRPELSDGNHGTTMVQPASSYGISTPSPEPFPQVSSTYIAVQARPNLQQLLDQALIQNRQLTLNLNNIPPRNIVPPEIGFTSREAFDSGTKIAISSVPKAPGLASIGDLGDIQRNNYNTETILLNGREGYEGRPQERIPKQPLVFSRVDSDQNEVIPVKSRSEGYPQSLGGNTQLLRNTQPNAYRIYPMVELKNENSSNVQVANIVASPVECNSENSPLQREDIYDDSGTETLWNRYGRTAKFGWQ